MHALAIISTAILFILYVWAFYNLPILLMGLKTSKRENPKNKQTTVSRKETPIISIIIPAKNEEPVINRLIEALLKMNYPPAKTEIIIVEDGSTDNTVGICHEYIKRHPNNARLIRQTTSSGKPVALNHGLKHATGEIVAVFDADNIPENDALANAVKYFEDPSVTAVQGRTFSINENQNVLTKVVSYEEAIAFQTHLQGREALNLFVPLTGSCCFIRKNVVKKIGEWKTESLCEDLEISVRLATNGYKIKYASDVKCFKETTAKLNQLITQRTRWFRGSMEVMLKHGKIAKNLNPKNLDVLFTLAGPYIFALCFVGLIASICGFLVPTQPSLLSESLSYLALLLTAIHLLIFGTTLIFATNMRRILVVLWLVLINVYWLIESFIAAYALLLIALRRPRIWKKTKKTGAVTYPPLENSD